MCKYGQHDARRFDLTLELTVMKGGKAVEGHLEYNEDLFARETAVRLIDSLQVRG